MPDSSISHIAISFAKKFGTVAAVFLIGKYDLSIAWLIGPVILSVVREEWKRESDMRRNIAKATAMSSEKEVILARVDDLPSWVFFPDVERAEWLNKIFKQVWPNVNSYAKALLKDSIEPGVRNALAAYKLNGFAFERMILGSIPIRIGGVKVYDRNVSRNEIIMDLDIFYAGDCDISFSLSGVKGGIKDFQLHGMCRIVMKPLISTIPLVGGLQIFFLNNPTIDFNLVGVADLLDMPGLSDILRRIIVEQVAAMMVLPNKLPIQLSDVVAATELKTPEPEGVLRVHVVEAKDLMKKDISMLGKGKSDPYAVLNIGAQQFRTQTIDNTVNPKWDYWCECVVSELFGQKIQIKLFDSDDTQKDENLGRATVDVNQVIKKGEVDLWVTLEDAKHGMIHLRLTWLMLSSNNQDLAAALAETQLLRVTSMSTAVLIVYLDAVKNLPQARPQSKPDPYVVLTVNKKTEQTITLYRTSDPVFEQGYTFLVQHPRTDSLFIKVVDNKTGQMLAQLEHPILTLLEKPNLQIEKQPFSVPKAGPETKIQMSLTLRILKREEPATSEDADGDSVSLGGEVQPLVKQGSLKKAPPSPVRKQMSTQSTGSSSSLGGTGVEESVMSHASYSLDSPPSDMRHRNNSISSTAGEHGLGRIQLTLRYSSQRQRLVVVVHKIVNLPLKDPSNIPDPYVKLYLLPDRKDSKRKTETMKDNCNPVFDETLEYVISSGDLNSRQLEVSVVTKKGWSASVMGQVLVSLSDLDLAQALTLWFDLQPEIPRDA